MKCKIANNISSHKFSLSLLFLVVISVNFSSAFANNLQKNKIEKKFSSFLSANDTSENMDALDDLSMFADMDNLDELEKVAENLKSKISGKGEDEKGKTNGKEEKVFFEKKKENLNLEKDVKKIDDKNVEEDERIVLKDFTTKKSKNEQKVMEENKINNSSNSKPQKQNKKADNVNNSKTHPSSSAPKSKKYAIIKSKPDYKKMYSKSKSEPKSNVNLNSNAKTKPIVNNIKKNPNANLSDNASKKEEKKSLNKISEKKVSNNNKSQSDDSSNKKKSSPLKIKINPPVSVKKIEESNKQKETELNEKKSVMRDSQLDTTTTISTNKPNTNWISILDKTIKKNENKNKKENTNPSFSNQDSGIENITEDFESDSSSSLKNKFIKPENKYNPNPNNVHKNTEVSLPKEEDKKLFSELDPNFVKNLLKMQNDPNIKKLLTSAGGVNLKNQNEENISKNSPSFSIRKISHENNENSDNSLNEPNFMQLSDSNIPFDVPSQDNSFIHSMPMPMQSQQSFNPMRFIQKSKEKINKSQIRNYYKPEELDMSKLVYINDLINKVKELIFEKINL
jgi:hypothetical protein